MAKGIVMAAILVLAVTIAAPAFAGDTSSPGIEQRQRNQQQRIDEGVRNGSLTPAEAARLEREQAQIERQERRLKADGDFTPRERARIQHRLDQSSRHIYREKHDRQGAP
ncbi:MAG: hypothetical protein HZB63_01475 [Deltaproteobacteria bacterium]|nr:hypothetical protein [Deltaproteobacteria bacterium]